MVEILVQAQFASGVQRRHFGAGAGAARRAVDRAGPGGRAIPVEFAGRNGHGVFQCASGGVGGPESSAIVTPAKPGCSGCTTGNCSCAAALIISLMRTMSRPFVRRQPQAERRWRRR